MQDLPPSALPGISPSRGEIGWGHRPYLNRKLRSESRGRRKSISPLEGEMPGRAEGGVPWLIALLFILLCFALPAHAASKTAVEKQFHAWIDPAMTIAEAHGIVEAAERALESAFPGAEMLIHLDPEGQIDNPDNPLLETDETRESIPE